MQIGCKTQELQETSRSRLHSVFDPYPDSDFNPHVLKLDISFYVRIIIIHGKKGKKEQPRLYRMDCRSAAFPYPAGGKKLSCPYFLRTIQRPGESSD